MLHLAWRGLRIVILASMASACYYWGPGPSDLRTLPSGKTYPQARVVLRDGHAFMLVNARLSQDSVTGTMRSVDDVRTNSRAPFSAALVEVQSVHVQRFSIARTLGLIVAVPVMLVGTLMTIVIVDCAIGACVTT